MTQRQEFRVIEFHKDFEIREYLPCVIAEVRVSSNFSSASSAGFGSLFRYISKGNNAAQSIAMTAPVIVSQREDKSQTDEWFVSFVMPSGSLIGHLPDPNDPNVRLRELETETCVASSFRGRATSELAKKKIAELREAAAKAHISLSSESRVCRFDPPIKPGFLQYNEIVIPAYLSEL
jgi:hypothetical protein